MSNPLDRVLADWTALGVLFGARPSKQTPDIEDLLLRTADVMPTFARLLPTTVTWLVQYERLVCRHRLACLAEQVTDDRASATLGLILDLARENTQSGHLNIAVAACRTLTAAQPLFDVDRRSSMLAGLAENEACSVAKQWGLWTTEPSLKPDAIRPANWLINQNPTLRDRAIFSGNLRATILATLSADPEAGRSEAALARACRVTRKALREALDHLEFCGLVERRSTDAGIQTVLQLDRSAA